MPAIVYPQSCRISPLAPSLLSDDPVCEGQIPFAGSCVAYSHSHSTKEGELNSKSTSSACAYTLHPPSP